MPSSASRRGNTTTSYEVGAFGADGTIDGVAVPCCTAESQVWSHTGYEIDDDDIADVLALHRRFGTPVPPEYRRHL